MRKKVTLALVILSLIACTVFAASCENTDECSHSGGTATCIHKAVCEKCGEEYGELADHVFGEWKHDDEKHWKECTTEGCTAKSEEGNHEGGTATCVEKATCSSCNAQYGEVSATHTWATEWSSDGTKHWHACTVTGCTAKNDEAACAGGVAATCKTKSVCSTCNKEYGDVDADNHESNDEFNYVSNNNNTHKKTYKCCGAVAEESETCSSETPATCVERATCDYCKTQFGEVSATHTWATEWSSDGMKHWHECTVTGCTAKNDEAACAGGTATCATRATCDVCGNQYGTLADHTYGEWKHDALKHWKECTTEGCTAKSEEGDHTGGKATHTEQATCDVCGEKYGDLIPHTYGEWLHDAEGHWKECSCGVATDKTSHSFVWDKTDALNDYKVCECGEKDESATFSKTVSAKNQKVVVSGTNVSLNLDGIGEYASVELIKFGNYELGNNIAALSISDELKADTQKHGEQIFTVTVKGADGETHEVSVSVLLVTKEISTLADFLDSCRYYGTDIYGYYVLTNNISYEEGFGSKAAAATRAWRADKKGFKGTFDGQGHTITWKNGYAHGAFGVLYGATIKNVNFHHAWYNGDWGGTAVAFSATGTTFDNVKISIACNATTKADSAPIIDEMAGCAWKNCTISSAKSVAILIKIALKDNIASTYENVTITATYEKFSTDIESFDSIEQIGA